MATLRNRIAYTIRQKLNKALFSLKVRHFPTQRYLFDQTYTVWYTEELWRELGARSGADFAFVNHVNDKFVSLIKSEAPLSRHSPGINTVLTLITNEIQYWRIFLRSRRINIRQYYLWWKKKLLEQKAIYTEVSLDVRWLMFYERGSYCIFRFFQRYAFRILSSSDCKKPELTFGLYPKW